MLLYIAILSAYTVKRDNVSNVDTTKEKKNPHIFLIAKYI